MLLVPYMWSIVLSTELIWIIMTVKALYQSGSEVQAVEPFLMSLIYGLIGILTSNFVTNEKTYTDLLRFVDPDY